MMMIIIMMIIICNNKQLALCHFYKIITEIGQKNAFEHVPSPPVMTLFMFIRHLLVNADLTLGWMHL